MEKVTKKYLNRLLYGRDWNTIEVDSFDPEMVDTENITSFCFLEQSFIIDGEDVYTGEEKRVSPVYHVGTRISVLEALEMCKDSPHSRQIFERLYQQNNNASVCKSDLGYLFAMDDDEITLEEYINSKKSNKSL